MWGCAVFAVVGVVLAILMATLAVQLGGGWDDVLDLSKPQADDAEVVAARSAGAASVEAELAHVIEEIATPVLGGARTVTAPPVGESATDEITFSGCSEGQHNWKRDDPYDLVCWEQRSAILAAPGRDAPATGLVALDAALRANGWQSDGLGLEAAIDRVNEWERAGGTGMGPIDPTGLPGAWYRRDGARLTVSFDPRPNTSRPRHLLEEGEYLVGLMLEVESYSE